MPWGIAGFRRGESRPQVPMGDGRGTQGSNPKKNSYQPIKNIKNREKLEKNIQCIDPDPVLCGKLFVKIR